MVLNDSSKYPIALGVACLCRDHRHRCPHARRRDDHLDHPVVVIPMLMQRHVLEGTRGAVKG
ncbi:hypothetical protein KLK06_24805 [Nonomuraea sp. NEAU-A123]|nr:hypothetical protein [Nonomuraea sp. NEAU-A123]